MFDKKVTELHSFRQLIDLKDLGNFKNIRKIL